MLDIVTYTYNDHAMVESLLRVVEGWGLPVRELIVVDDGSDEPLRLSGGLAQGTVRIERSPVNLGPAQAKRLGIGLAEGDLILSLDADIRPHDKWLGAALACLAEPDVALVGAKVVQKPLGDLFTHCLHLKERTEATAFEARFLQAGIWLFRRSAWQELEGLDDFDQRTHEDLHLSLKIGRAGLRMIQCNTFPVHSVRRIGRLDHCRRQAAYMGPTYASLFARGRAAEVLEDVAREMDVASRVADGAGERYLIYLELLRICWLSAWLGRQGQKNAVRSAGEAVAGAYAGYGNIAALLLDDLRALCGGSLPDKAPLLPELLAHANGCAGARRLKDLDSACIVRIREDDRRQRPLDHHYLRRERLG